MDKKTLLEMAAKAIHLNISWLYPVHKNLICLPLDTTIPAFEVSPSFIDPQVSASPSIYGEVSERMGLMTQYTSLSINGEDVDESFESRSLLSRMANHSSNSLPSTRQSYHTKVREMIDKDGFKVTWNPLNNDADEACLESALSLDVAWKHDRVYVGTEEELFEYHNGDKQKARRIAGTRAAALCAN